MRKYLVVGGNGQRGLAQRSEMDRRYRRLRNRPMLERQLDDAYAEIMDRSDDYLYDDDYYFFDWECSCCPHCGGYL